MVAFISLHWYKIDVYVYLSAVYADGFCNNHLESLWKTVSVTLSSNLSTSCISKTRMSAKTFSISTMIDYTMWDF